MILTARALTAVASPNIFTVAQNIRFTEGDGPTIYFQLVDSSLDSYRDGFNPPGRRYVAAADASLTVSFGSVNEARRVTRKAVNPFPNDTSIWKVSLLPSDRLSGSLDVSLELSEGAKTTRGVAKNLVVIEPLNTAF